MSVVNSLVASMPRGIQKLQGKERNRLDHDLARRLLTEKSGTAHELFDAFSMHFDRRAFPFGGHFICEKPLTPSLVRSLWEIQGATDKRHCLKPEPYLRIRRGSFSAKRPLQYEFHGSWTGILKNDSVNFTH
jgi:hypothetical protein